MDILSLDHAALLVHNREKSRQFYTTVLGLYEIPSNGNCWLTNGRIHVHLLEARGPFHAVHYSHEDLKDGHTPHLAFCVDDVGKVLLHLHAHGIPIACGPRPRWPGGEQCYICDPDGYVLEFFST